MSDLAEDLKRMAEDNGVHMIPGETEEELRARYRATLSQANRGTMKYIDIVVTALIGVEKPASTRTIIVQVALAIMWMKRHKPKPLFARAVWWMKIIWRLL